MKRKIAIVGFVMMLAFVFTIPVWALENEFGGYFRARAYRNIKFSGDGTKSNNLSQWDTRTRLYYTAILHENLKLVNKFEFDAYFGDTGAASEYGDIGADGVNFEIKHTYADFNYNDINFKIGVQGGTIARGFIFDDDFAGAIITKTFDNITVPFIWVKHTEDGQGPHSTSEDVDYYALSPIFNFDNLVVNPYYLKATNDMDSLNFIGFDLDYTADNYSLWSTFIYECGKTVLTGGAAGTDSSGHLYAVGGSVDLGVELHGQCFFSSGTSLSSSKDKGFSNPAGRSYYWAEIMGYGIIDEALSNNSPGDGISNILAANIGISFAPIEKLNITFDIWHAELDEEVTASVDEALGTEFDLKASYMLIDNLTLDVLFAYLNAGDSTGDKNPYEMGTRLSLSF